MNQLTPAHDYTLRPTVTHSELPGLFPEAYQEVTAFLNENGVPTASPVKIKAVGEETLALFRKAEEGNQEALSTLKRIFLKRKGQFFFIPHPYVVELQTTFFMVDQEWAREKREEMMKVKVR